MGRHAPAADLVRELDAAIARIGALEAGAPDEGSRRMAGVLRVLAEGQKRSVAEAEHLRKAIDLLTEELFRRCPGGPAGAGRPAGP